MELLRNDFELRLYQQKILNTTLKNDSLVVLPTGLGKTFVGIALAALRIKNGGKAVMLAPTKPLANQHKQRFEKWTKKVNVSLLTGEVRPQERGELWEENQIITATPQTVENDLIAGRIDLKNVKLLIVDEAHRARKGYSYVFLAKQYYKLADDPRVLGLTASPGYDKSRIMKVCDNLGIEEIEVRSEDDPDVQAYVKKKKMERVVLELPEELEKVKKGMERAMKVRLSKLKERGFTESKSLDKVYKSDLLDLQGGLRSKIAKGNADPPVYNAITLTAACLKISHALELLQTQGVKPLVLYLKKLKKDSSRAAKQLRKDKWFKNATLKAYNLYENGEEHPKFEKLEEIIEENIGEGDKRIIVFTQYRATVDRIVEFLKEREKINPIKFIGQSKKDGLTQKQQIKRLREFREGKYNCLVATSVAEEGLDVKEADLAIFFEPVPSALRSVQRKGRVGRTKVGEIYVMYTKDCIDEKYYWIAYHREKKMKKALNKLSEELGEEQKSMEDFK